MSTKLRATCEPEGYTAEKAKGNLRSLAAGETARFATRFGYVTAAQTAALERKIAGMTESENV
jgi:monosaccharide-transporting ATPase